MSGITVTERFGWTVSDNGGDQLYVAVTDSANVDPADVRQAVEDEAPDTVDLGAITLYRTGVEVEEISNTHWIARATYATRERTGARVVDVSNFSFETRGSQQRVTQSLETVESYGDAPPNFGGAIGVTESGVEGVDVTVPVFSFTITKTRATCDATYIGNLYALTGTTNASSFAITTDDDASITLAAGEGLYLGAAGVKRSGQPWELVHAFAASPNITGGSGGGLTVGDITGIAKKGWEYLWAYYAPKVEEGSGTSARLITAPIAAYVERVYRSGDWSYLDL